MPGYFHSVRLDESKCEGCTNCIKSCPTEAIRVRDGKAQIIEKRCIDCGECIRHCPNQAKIAVTDDLDDLDRFQYTVALPAPAFCGQFDERASPDAVFAALIEMGFDGVFEVAVGAEAVTLALRDVIQSGELSRPLISSACPAILRLIQIRFPDLLQHVVPLETPMEISARLAKKEICAKTGLDESSVGAFFISPCPAKVTAVKEPLGNRGSYVDGVIGISQVYGEVSKRIKPGEQVLQRATPLGMQWGYAGGENRAVGLRSLMAVDGIHSAISILEGIQNGELNGVQYVECQACVGGCMGGALTIQNPFVARARTETALQEIQASGVRDLSIKEETVADLMRQGFFDQMEPLCPRPAMRLDDDVEKAIAKMQCLEELVEELPGFDCGSCGSPTCRALAEDIVQGVASKTDCFFKLREKVSLLAEQMVAIAQTLPPIMGAKGGTRVPVSVALRDVVEELNLEVVTGEASLDSNVITGAYISDLLSDVMANADEGSVWVTIQIHQNIVAVAVVAALNAVIIAGGRRPEAATITRAHEQGVPILTSSASAYDISGRLYSMLSRG